MAQCKEQVWDQWHYHDCRRNAVEDGYCRQHHPRSVQARQEASNKRQKEKEAQSPAARLERAQERITELEKMLSLLYYDVQAYGFPDGSLIGQEIANSLERVKPYLGEI